MIDSAKDLREHREEVARLHMTITNLFLFFSILGVVTSFRVNSNGMRLQAAKSQKLQMSFGNMASGLMIASSLLGSSFHSPAQDTFPSVMMAATEVRQGVYKEYTVEKADPLTPDQLKRTYKTADETDTSKNKYWTILAVLLAGSFIIPMVQYYWYVAEED